MNRGYNKMIESVHHWPPNAIEFRGLCLPTAEDMGLLSLHKAFKQAVGNDTNKTPEVIYTLLEMAGEVFIMRRESSDKALNRFSEWYLKTVEHVLNGGKLPKVELKIERKPLPTRKDKGRAAFKAMLANFEDEGGTPKILQPKFFKQPERDNQKVEEAT